MKAFVGHPEPSYTCGVKQVVQLKCLNDQPDNPSLRLTYVDVDRIRNRSIRPVGNRRDAQLVLDTEDWRSCLRHL